MSDLIHGRCDRTTMRLWDISYRPLTYPDDVPLDVMPAAMGPLLYDPATRLGVPLLPPEPRPDADVIADLEDELKGAPAKVLARLVLRLERREPGLIDSLGLKTKTRKEK